MKKVAPYLFRGPRPTPQELIDNKIDVVINLESGFYDYTHHDAYEHLSGFVIYKFPCSDILPPKQKQASAILAVIETNLALDKRVLVHCLTGKDRTGFVCAAYRMREQGWSFEKAEAEWIADGRHWCYWPWRFALKNQKWNKG